jgi:2'-5' RNA ligase
MKQSREIYDQLWREAQPALQRGEPRLDPYLLDKSSDRRRGVSLAFWLSPAVLAKAMPFLDALKREFPGQYFYQPGELHVTLLTFISTSDSWRNEIGDLAEFRIILREVLARQQPFKMEFCGVTAAPNAVMMQGFPLDDGLEKIRADIRESCARHGFTGRLDRRYANRAAHVTAMRFCRPSANWERLATVVEENRRTSFGEMEADTLRLTWGDWYASLETVRVLEEFHLQPK